MAGEGKGWSAGRTFVPRQACIVCGDLFYAPPTRLARGHGLFCTKTCRMKHRMRPVVETRQEFACERCGKTLRLPPSIAQGKRYCSKACQVAAKAAVKRTCQQCGADFDGSPARKFCGRKCWGKSRPAAAERPIGVCEACGKWYPIQIGSKGRYCSMNCVGRSTTARNAVQGYSRTKGGKREDLGGKYFRSSWEANWARYLTWLQTLGEVLEWDFEPETFEFKGIKRGARFYTPDFRVKNAGGSVEYHEIKGWMDQRSRTKLKRMAKYYPAIKVIVVDGKAYTAVARKIGKAIPGWEWNAKHSN